MRFKSIMKLIFNLLELMNFSYGFKHILNQFHMIDDKDNRLVTITHMSRRSIYLMVILLFDLCVLASLIDTYYITYDEL